MGKLIEVNDSEIVAIKDKIREARRNLGTIRDIRKKCADAYFRQPLGTEVDGRADYVASTVHNHVHGALPKLMKRNLASDQKIKVKGKDATVSQALKQWVRERINDAGGFRLFNDSLLDGLIYSNGTAKLWWSRVWGKPVSGEKEMDADEIAAIANDPEWTIESVEALPVRVVQSIDPTDPVTPVINAQGKQMYRVKCTYHELKESGPVVVPMPPEEFVAEKGKIRVNDRRGCGHIREMMGGELIRESEKLSTPTEPYYRNLKAAINAPVDTSLEEEKDERDTREAPYWDYSPDVESGPDAEFIAADYRKKCVVVEWADYVVCKKGCFMPAIITFCNGEVVRVEQNEDGIIPYSTWSPMVDPHSIYGHGIGWLHSDDQNLQTVLSRAVMDNIAFSIDKPRMIRSRSADLLGLQSLTPGKLVVGQPGDFQDIDVGQLDPRIFTAIEFLKGEGEERGPGTRYNMGTDADTLNSTATGVSLIQRASLDKIDMIALAYSELFLVDIYNKLIYLAQQNLDKPVEMMVDGEPFTLTRNAIQGDYRAECDLGLEVDFDDRAFAKAQSQLAALMGVAAAYPMLAPVEVVQEHLKQVYLAAGERDLSKKIAQLPPVFKGWFPGREQLFMQAVQMMQAISGQAPPPETVNALPANTMGGAAAPGGPMPPSAVGAGSGINVPEAPGRDYVSGQDTSQPDETMMGGL